MNAREVIVEQLELSGRMIRGESEIGLVDATVRADLVDLMARILVAVFQAKGGRVDDRASLQSQDQAGTSGLLPDWHGPLSECCGVWSADGRYYFFVSGTADGFNLWAVRESAGLFHKALSQPFQLTNGPMSLGLPVPSPDGKKLFANGHLPRGELVVYDNKSHQFLPFRESRPRTWTSPRTASGSLTSPTPRAPCGAVARTVVNGSN
jgi:hypothetical protein